MGLLTGSVPQGMSTLQNKARGTKSQRLGQLTWAHGMRAKNSSLDISAWARAWALKPAEGEGLGAQAPVPEGTATLLFLAL